MKTKKLLCLALAILLITACLGTAVFHAIAEETAYSLIVHVTAGSGISSEGGSVTGAGEYKAGDKVTLVATPNEGYCSITWGSYDVSGLPTVPFDPQFTVTFTMPDKLTQVTAQFREHMYSPKSLDNRTHIEACMFCGDTVGSAVACTDGNGDDWCDECGYSWHVHTPGEWVVESESHYRECTKCGDLLDEGEHNQSIVKHNEASHWKECVCGRQTKAEPHGDEEKCSVCGYSASIPAYTLTFDYYPDREDDEPFEMDVAKGETVELKNYLGEKTQTVGNKTYKLTGFSDKSGKVLTSVKMNSDITVYGVWTDVTPPTVKEYVLTIDYDLDSREDEVVETVYFDGAEVRLDKHLVDMAKTVDGKRYRLVGFTDESGKELTVVTMNKNRTVFGRWEEIESEVWILVGFKLYGGKFEEGARVLSCGLITLDELIEYCDEAYVPTKDGAAFKGWAAYGKVKADENGCLESGITLKAIWE